jgi:hypothetical protein
VLADELFFKSPIVPIGMYSKGGFATHCNQSGARLMGKSIEGDQEWRQKK